MNKNAIQKFAIWARKELIAQVSQRAYQYGIDESGFGDASADTLNGRLLTAEEKSQRQELIGRIREKGYKQVMEEVAYTWFNRFIALRFMEVNNYLPSHIRVFSDSTGAFKPEILSDVLHLDLPGLNREKVAEYIESNDTEGLYRYLLLTQCNALNDPLPRMFEEMDGYTELLLPNNILKQDSVLGHMVADIPEEDWQDAVQIIGWLYQYYNTELKDDTFAQLKKNVKITKERIPSATQLFTPDWIVRYMVENSLGRIYVDKRKNEGIYADGRGLDEMTWREAESERIATEKLIADKMGWKYYLPEAEQTQEVRKQLDEIQAEFANLDVKGIKVIDPCMGSGHILVYAFDVLMQIYEATGYSQRDAAQSILENNLFGLDIDDRAAQLAYFAVMMKARQYDRRLLTRGIQPHIYAFAESNTITTATLHDMGITLSQDEYDTAVKQVLRLLDELRDAKEYGSILTVTPCDWDLLRRFAVSRTEDEGGQQLLGIHGEQIAAPLLQRLINIGEALSQQYDVVVTNPPYMAVSNAGVKVNDYVKKNFPDSKADMFAVFIERCGQMTKKNGYQAMITQHAWMFLSSFEKLRTKLLAVDIVNMAHLGARAFEEIGGEVVQTTSFVIRKSHIADYKGEYCRLIEPTSQQGKEDMFLAGKNRYAADQSNFSKIPGSPVAYWVSKNFIKCFDAKRVSFYGNALEGIKTSDNDRFLRLWFEPNFTSVSLLPHSPTDSIKWVFTTKGGEFRKWYGNIEYVMYWANNGREIRAFSGSSFYQESNFHRAATTWTYLTSGKISFRLLGDGFFYNNKGPAVFCDSENIAILLTGLLNTNVANYIQRFINPTLTILPGNIRNIPCILPANAKKRISQAVADCVDISRTDWNAYEISWDFKRNPLV